MVALPRQMVRSVVASVLAVCAIGPARADDKAAQADEGLAELLRVEHNKAVDLYNTRPTRDVAGAYYYFRASLMSAEKGLGHRPDLQRILRRGLEDARRDGSLDERAWALKRLTLAVRAALLPDAADETPAELAVGKTPWQRLGGDGKVRKIVDDWVDALVEDRRVNLSRDGKYPMTAQRVAALKESFFKLGSSATGGPHKYTGKPTRVAHEGMRITDDEYDAAVADLRTALVRNDARAKDVDFMVAVVEGLRPNFVRPDIDKRPDPDKRPGVAPPGGGVIAAIGGEEKLRKIVDDFVDLMVEDKRVNFTRDGKHPADAETLARIKKSMVEMGSEAMGGTRKYTGPKLLEIHKKMGVTAAEFDAARADLKIALLKNEIQPLAADLVLRMFDERRPSFVVK